MSKLPVIVVCILFSLIVSSNATAQDNKNQKKEVQTVKNESGKPVNTICPVSTEEADSEITYEYKGKTYALCCNSCLKKFKKDPEKYISRLSEDGKSVVKPKETK